MGSSSGILVKRFEFRAFHVAGGFEGRNPDDFARFLSLEQELL
jgi:hypothetical protein